MYLLILLLNCVLLCTGSPSVYKESLTQGCFQPALTPEQRFEEFIEKYDKNYSDEEKEFRFQVFKEKLELIERLNAEAGEEIHAIHSLSDLTERELKKRLGYRPSMSSDLCEVKKQADVPNVDIPERLDYRESSAVTPVKDQGGCGSCFVFSLTGVMESQYLMKHKQNLSFSEQQILDCQFTKEYDVCHYGGNPSEAATTMMKQYGGIESEKDYPYTSTYGTTGECHFDRNKIKGKVASCQYWDIDEMSIKKVLTHYGPLSIAVAYCGDIVNCPGTSGIYRGGTPYCTWDQVNHAVLLVGYGTDNGVPYWLIKNSWGPKWQEDGYFRIEAGVNCMKITAAVSSYQVP